MRRFLVSLAVLGCAGGARAQAPANVIVFLADDLGHGDVGPYDHDQDPLTPAVTNTPVLDQLAVEGVRLTEFYSNSSVCSPARAALLTGRHSIRSEITHVFKPGSAKGLPVAEITLPEMLAPLGYRTGIIGKWHLGEALEFLPLQQGFDEFYGVPYSNNAIYLPLLRGNSVIAASANLPLLTESFTTEAQQFIDSAVAASEPFLLYVAYTAPHVPLFVSPPFDGITGRGLYADSVFELDSSIGRILDQLDLHGIASDTVVMFTSDNGTCDNSVVGPDPGSPGAEEPLRWACGSNLPFSGFKFSFLEGGLRVPFIARWPGVLPAGVERDTLASILDVLPTIATMTGATAPQDRALDGEDLFGVLTVDAPRALDALHFYALYQGAQWGTRTLKCTRSGDFKLFYDTSLMPTALFDLSADPGETTSLSGPQIGTLWDRGRDFDCRLDEPLASADPFNACSQRPTLTSSSVGCATSSRAVDDDLKTWWLSDALPDQTLQVDLGAPLPLEQVILRWAVPFATQYALELSNDGLSWQPFFTEGAGNGGLDVIATGLSARYLRLRCLQSTGLGYRLRELRVQAARLPDSPTAIK